ENASSTAVSLFPRDRIILVTAAMVLLARGDVDRAVKEYGELTAIRAASHLARTYIFWDRIEEAAASLDLSISMFKEYIKRDGSGIREIRGIAATMVRLIGGISEHLEYDGYSKKADEWLKKASLLVSEYGRTITEETRKQYFDAARELKTKMEKGDNVSGDDTGDNKKFLTSKKTFSFSDRLAKFVTAGKYDKMPEWMAALFVAPWFESIRIFFLERFLRDHEPADEDEEISLLEGWGWVMIGGLAAIQAPAYYLPRYIASLGVMPLDNLIISVCALTAVFYFGTIISHFLVNLYRIVYNAFSENNKMPLLSRSRSTVGSAPELWDLRSWHLLDLRPLSMVFEAYYGKEKYFIKINRKSNIGLREEAVIREMRSNPRILPYLPDNVFYGRLDARRLEIINSAAGDEMDQILRLGMPYIVSKAAPGISAQEDIKKLSRRRDPGKRTEIVTQRIRAIGTALKVFHGEKFFHRDLDESEVFIDGKTSKVSFVDFNTAVTPGYGIAGLRSIGLDRVSKFTGAAGFDPYWGDEKRDIYGFAGIAAAYSVLLPEDSVLSEYLSGIPRAMEEGEDVTIDGILAKLDEISGDADNRHPERSEGSMGQVDAEDPITKLWQITSPENEDACLEMAEQIESRMRKKYPKDIVHVLVGSSYDVDQEFMRRFAPYAGLEGYRDYANVIGAALQNVQ
ncbi:MAG TPA: hypothetical protein PKZ41_04175, partial [Candidatus Omnitrophota bacterium]|nr:hypothetical protein [Candidatus Omnitrophota bacterium]